MAFLTALSSCLLSSRSQWEMRAAEMSSVSSVISLNGERMIYLSVNDVLLGMQYLTASFCESFPSSTVFLTSASLFLSWTERCSARAASGPVRAMMRRIWKINLVLEFKA